MKGGSKEILKNRENCTSAKNCHRRIIYRRVNLEIWDGLGGHPETIKIVYQIIYIHTHTHRRRGSITLRTVKWYVAKESLKYTDRMSEAQPGKDVITVTCR